MFRTKTAAIALVLVESPPNWPDLGLKIAINVPNPPVIPASPVYFGQSWPKCCVCAAGMAFDYTDPFGGRNYKCAKCSIDYCDYDCMFVWKQ